MKTLKTVARLIAGTALIAGMLVSPAAPVAAQDEDDSLSAVRAATASFHSISEAEAAGYALAALPCFDRPGVGGMGLHWVNGSLFAETVTATKPQALVYEVDGDELTLVAVEYLIPFTLVPATAEPPSLFGEDFHHAFLKSDPLPFWELHAWIWRSNPLGMFADYNPEVALCPGSESDD
jgi:hypothetical protein